jgi:SAM-dependent methyltransferase
MKIPVDHANGAYWDLIAENYDRNFPETVIGRVQRDAVWHELDRTFQPGMRILELNCGTGIDAVHLAQLEERVDFRVMDTEKIETLVADAPFDGAFSNFSGLNCVQDISGVADKLALLLKPSAQILLCMVGRFSPWEMAWHLAHGKPVVALHSFRRKPTAELSAKGAVLVHYPSVRDLRRMFAPEFQLRGWKGIGVAVPPSCLDSIARMAPRLVGGLAKIDRYLSSAPIFRSLGDCVLLEFERLREEFPSERKMSFS